MKIAFIGMGKMGLPMAMRLRAAGHDVVGYDVSEERRALSVAEGFRMAADVAQAVADVEAVISSLPNDAALLETAPAVLAAIARGTPFIDTTTVSLGASQRVAGRCEEADVPHLRVAVSGNPAMVEAGALTTISSGPRDAHERILPLLDAMGQRDFYLGGQDEARVMKLIINHLVATSIAALGEALALGEANGIERRHLLDVLADSAAGSPVIRAKAGPLARRDFTPTFSVDQMRKDVGLIQAMAASVDADSPFASLVARLLDEASGRGMGHEDYAAMSELFGPRASDRDSVR